MAKPTEKLLIALVVIALIASLFTLPSLVKQRETAANRPVVVKEERNYLGAVRDFAVSGEHLYLLLDERGILMQYDLSGRFEQSYGVKQSANGQGALYLDSNRLCWMAKGHRYYFFRDGAFLELDPELAQKMGQEIYQSRGSHKPGLRIAADGSEYTLEWGSIWRQQNGSREKIINRPLWLSLFDPLVDLSLAGIAFAVAVIYTLIKARRTGKDRYVIGALITVVWGLLLSYQYYVCIEPQFEELRYMYVVELVCAGLGYALVYFASRHNLRKLMWFYCIAYAVLVAFGWTLAIFGITLWHFTIWDLRKLFLLGSTLTFLGAVLSGLWLWRSRK